MRTLTLPLKRQFFEQIAVGQKVEEFRLKNSFWTARLEGASFDRVVLTLGYPAADNVERRIVVPWMGMRTTFIEHSIFGDGPVEVFAIKVNTMQAASHRDIQLLLSATNIKTLDGQHAYVSGFRTAEAREGCFHLNAAPKLLRQSEISTDEIRASFQAGLDAAAQFHGLPGASKASCGSSKKTAKV